MFIIFKDQNKKTKNSKTQMKYSWLGEQKQPTD